MPQFVLSNMPVESASAGLKMTKPQIYFGQKTDTDVYVRHREQALDYTQGESNNYTTYAGAVGIQIETLLRRMILGWVLNDFKNLTFSDRITTASSALFLRTI